MNSMVRPIKVYIGLGSNLNNPTQQIQSALLALQEIPNTSLQGCSDLYQTTPIGFLDQPDFINAVAELNTMLSARDLLTHLQKIEHNHGRIRDGKKNHPRTLDLDLLLYGNERINEPDLVVPHPRMFDREFVLKPLFEIAPGLQTTPAILGKF